MSTFDFNDLVILSVVFISALLALILTDDDEDE